MDMFAGLKQNTGGMNLPLFETRKALIIINLQNDSLYVKDDLYITKNRDFVPRLKEMIPYFRKHGEIVWVKTHLGILPSAPAPDAAKVEEESAKLAEKNRKEQKQKERQMKDELQNEQPREEAVRRDKLDPVDPNGGPGKDFPTYHPSSKAKGRMMQASSETRAEKRTADMQVFDDKENVFEKQLTKPRKGQQARFYIAGTKGAEICDDLLDTMDESQDLVVTKHHYSAFDQTSLLTALRAKLVTEIYLCGCLTNVGVYSTAADAVQHGLQVTVVEDCLGYRSEDKHEEAMKQMADIMGVHGIDTEEIIEESGGRPVPDAETPGITLEELSLHSPTMTARGLANMAAMDAVDQENPIEQPADPAKIGRKSSSPIQPVTAVDLSQRNGKPQIGPDSTPKPSPEPSSTKNRGSWNLSRSHSLGPNDRIGSGDSRIIHNAIDPNIMNTSFSKVKNEVDWQTMFHRSGQVPRLVAVQGEIGPEGDIPLYRHPADESPPLSPFTPVIQQIRRGIEKVLSQSFNHALIQLYRDGVDNISEHADKTLDIVRGSAIVNVSIGAQRVMTLRTKKSKVLHGTDSPNMRQSQRIKMPHNSVFVLGPQTNREWLHGVRADKRPAQEKTEEEKAFGGERISITFRQIGTFMDEAERYIWGAGATGKTADDAHRISKDCNQMESMINAFGKENHNTDFDWDAEYGLGFDVVNLTTKQSKLSLCTDAVANHRVQLCLCEKSISFTATEREASKLSQPQEFITNTTKFHTWMHGLSNSDNPLFHDLDDNASGIEGDLAILIYLEKRYPFSESVDMSSAESGLSSGPIYTMFAQSNELLFLWRELKDLEDAGRNSPPTTRFRLEEPANPGTSLLEEFHTNLGDWETHAAATEYIAGMSWTICDCAFWPVLNQIISASQDFSETRFPNLLAYHKRVLERDCVKIILQNGK